MKKRIALLLSFVLVLSLALCACGGEEKKESVVGTWKGTVNMAEAFNAEIAASGDELMVEYMSVDTFNLALVLELKEDGTYTMAVDADAMTETMDQLVVDMTEGMTAYFGAMLGIEEDVEATLEGLGINMDELVTELKDELASEDLFADMAAEGNYKAEDGKLHLSESLEAAADPTVYNTYELDGDTLTLGAGTEEGEEYAEYMFPMTLKRAK